jgi:peptidoglycan/xylan/chitin deacetylase (PgdA/CDA1 family)
MRRVLVAAIVLLLSTEFALAADAVCDPAGKDVLGVSRTIEIDAAGGPRYGDQYPPETLLQPGEVVLTFDDGPHPVFTQDILETLASQCTKATFFNVGEMAQRFPDVVRTVHAQGHTIGTHTWSHANLAHRSLPRAAEQIEAAIRTENEILPGQVAPFFRFPYLSDSKATLGYLAGRNLATFSIDVDSADYRTKTAERVVRNVMNGLAKTHGGIILFHDIHGVTAKALPLVLVELKAGNYKVVHLTAKEAATPTAQPAPKAPQLLVKRPRAKGVRSSRRRTT